MGLRDLAGRVHFGPPGLAMMMAVCVGATPATAWGQAAIAGTVVDTSGAPLPGVGVEARSPALIERARTTVTDGAGRYRLENLRPGLYTLTVSLQGWSPYVHSGIELAGTFTATVDVGLDIAPFADAVRVLGRLPVDVRSATRQVVLQGEVLRDLPTVRSYNAVVSLVPGVLTNSNDTVTGTATTQFLMHGGRTGEGRLLLDGLNIGSPPTGNSATSYVVDVGQVEEVTLSTGGASGEFETAGLVMNIVPKTGGNTVRGSMFASGTIDKLRSDNVTQALKDQGVPAVAPLTKVYDVSGTLGGPVLKDRVWYFVNAHTGGSTRQLPNVFYNLNAADASKWFYAPDLDRPEYSDRTFENAGARVTWRLTPRNTITLFYDAQTVCRTCTGATPGLSEPARLSPEAVGVLSRPLHVSQVTWSAPATRAWLFDAGFTGTFFGVGNFERQPNHTRGLIRVAEQCASGCAANGSIPGLVYRSQDFSSAYTGSYLWKGSATYLTGAHRVKVGYQHTFMTDDRTWMTNDQNLTYRVDNGVPNQLTQSISPWVNNARAGWDAVFVEDQWTRDRMTLQAAVRFDRARSWFPAQQEGPSRFLPTALSIPETSGVDSYKDITPRMALTFDVFGTGRTALKVNLGKYLESVGVTGIYANTNPTLRLPQTTSVFGTAGVTRAWTDANTNFVPDCDLLNPDEQDLRADGKDFCGVVSNTSFGKNVLTNNFDPNILDGWGVRPSDWDLGVSLQHQMFPRGSVEVTYARRWYHGFTVVDNLALQPADLTPFSVMAPLDPRLPGGGGYVVSGLYDVVPEKAGSVDNFVTGAGKYGAWVQYFNGLDVTFNLRGGSGLTFVGGMSTGQTIADSCEVRARLPELATPITGTSAFGPGLNASAVSPVSPYCHVAFGVLTQFKGLSSWIVPGLDIQLAATLQSRPGVMLSANYAAPNTAVAPALGRDLSGGASNVTINLVAPGTMYGDRVNELDLRISKVLRRGRSQTSIALDIYNALNSSAVLTYNSAFVPGGTWLQPLTILTPRFARITAEFTF